MADIPQKSRASDPTLSNEMVLNFGIDKRGMVADSSGWLGLKDLTMIHAVFICKRYIESSSSI